MKQVYYTETGGPEVLKIREVPAPEPKKNEVLVKMLATSVNGGDLGLRRGLSGKSKKLRKPAVIGIDVVGTVTNVGSGVTDFKIGDLVWGNSGPGNGTTAEYFVIPASKISHLPENMDPTDAAALPTAGITSITALLDVGKLKKGEHVLIRGIGGVGITAVQIAKANGAYVAALASSSIADGVKAAGADEVLDYHKVSIDDLGKYDLIFDTVGSDLNKLRKHLSKNGRLITIAVGRMMEALGSVIYGKHRIRLALGFSTHKRLDYLKRLVEKGKVKPVIDSVYPMDQVVDAHRRAEEHGVLGKVVVRIAG